ncbi:metallophosphoesterase [Candidatus Methylospira mobilis]|uniref:metallophosphoesterase family protein n=1 Tax=Candidatus Methylospira mobilis TaxID=1808979 RepID=UPI0028E98178|nr:metallophosphoesterase [Candidatus Methylospira mobilis]WNV04428.1 metallophosphoesterase [Candidatus Methylospira mobilis]
MVIRKPVFFTLIFLLPYTGHALAATDPVVLTFSTVGDSRVDHDEAKNAKLAVAPDAAPTAVNEGLSREGVLWGQNTHALNRVLQGVKAQKANILFFNGDMIMGYGNPVLPQASDAAVGLSLQDVLNSDLLKTYREYAYWRGFVASLNDAGVYVAPVPGNHEMQCSNTRYCSGVPKAAVAANENAWRDNMGDMILDTERLNALLPSSLRGITHFDSRNNPYNDPATLLPYAGSNPDAVSTDQKQLSYSFDIADSHFAVINTDAVGRDGHAPNAWLDADLTLAAGRGARHFFVFGHKPAYFYNYGTPPVATPPTGDLAMHDADARNAFWHVIVKHRATYFCGHEHIYKAAQFPSPPGAVDPANGRAYAPAYQVIVGSGGSPFDAAAASPGLARGDRQFAWATVKIHRSGAVKMEVWGFSDSYGPNTLLERRVLP